MTIPDMAELVEKFRLIQVGERRGKKGLPPPNQPDLDRVEQEVVNECDAYFRQRKEEYEADHQVQVGRMRPPKPATNPNVRIESVETDMRSKISENREDMEHLRDKTQRAIDEQRAFRTDHKLTHEAEFPRNRIKSVFLLGGLVLVETLINGLFFGDNLAAGLFGGVTQAAFFSAVNVLGIGLLAALAIRQCNHRRQTRRIAGGVGAGLVVVAAVVWNLGIAHFREALPTDYPPNPATLDQTSSSSDVAAAPCYRGPDEADGDAEAICLLTSRWFAMEGIRSWALMIIGLIMCGFAAWEFFRLDDRYPGYGRLARRLDARDEKRKKTRFALLREIKATFDAAETREHNAFVDSDPVGAWDRATKAHEKCVLAHNALRADAQNLERNCRRAIETYRGANRDAPRPVPEPAYWSAPWSAGWELPAPPSPPATGTRTEAEERRGILDRELQEGLQRLRAAHEVCRAEIDQIMGVRYE